MTLLYTHPVRFTLRGNAIYPFGLLAASLIVRFGVARGAAAAALAVLSLLLHELGHAATARAFGITVSSIGLCRNGLYICRRQGEGIREAVIAAAGPVTNLSLALLLWGAFPASDMQHWVATANAVLGLTNLLPLRGTDGLRIIQALSGSLIPCSSSPQ